MKPGAKILIIVALIAIVIVAIILLKKKATTPTDASVTDNGSALGSGNSSGSANDRPPLSQGSRGILVEYMQRAINTKWKYTPALATDGIWGPKTQIALESLKLPAKNVSYTDWSTITGVPVSLAEKLASGQITITFVPYPPYIIVNNG